MVEQLTLNQLVEGSSPSRSTRCYKNLETIDVDWSCQFVLENPGLNFSWNIQLLL